MAKSAGINRRTFIKNASLTAFAGATGGIATGSTAASAASSSKMANGKYDFDTVYDRVDHNTARWDSPPKSYPEGTFQIWHGRRVHGFRVRALYYRGNSRAQQTSQLGLHE